MLLAGQMHLSLAVSLFSLSLSLSLLVSPVKPCTGSQCRQAGCGVAWLGAIALIVYIGVVRYIDDCGNSRVATG